MEKPAIKVLIADDEADIVEIISFQLNKAGYQVIVARDGSEAIEKANAYLPECIILDVMMPKRNGFEVCEFLRSQPQFDKTFIVLLTALNDEVSHIKGLELGGDDFVSKPISPKVLLSRINALFRRISTSEESQKILSVNNLSIDPDQYKIVLDGKDFNLAKKEFELLYLLASQPGKVFLRNEILSQVWGNDVIVGDRTIDVHVRKIRSKLGIDCITTVKGVGYKFDY